ncbi:PREDICTED: UPF0602 protein C4orf47 homolog [Habropoda laboriosa]|uniref:UPF0602 protein C4orf47 homolog n=1 Tax=Habropoda laboriosa TaxID=597456 RepID=UPI00083D19FA|nr:PREDICTED: UPF0602 protein C4orf47 homolog [Habropoda laboriosa]
MDRKFLVSSYHFCLIFQGYFHDPSPAPFDKYLEVPVKFREGIEKGPQMLSGPPVRLFEKKFERIFTGEALYESWSIEAQERLQRERGKLGGRMLPSSPAKKHSTPGDWHGCFEKIAYFSPALKDRRRRRLAPEPPNPKIKPNPRGGPGYTDICFNPFPSYSHEPYDLQREKVRAEARFLTASAPLDRFPPNPYKDKEPGPTYIRPTEDAPKIIGSGRFYVPFPKRSGGNHSGCFDKFPKYSSEPYDPEKDPKEVAGVFVIGGPPLRSKYTNSIVDQVTKTSCNATNYMGYREQVYPLDK